MRNFPLLSQPLKHPIKPLAMFANAMKLWISLLTIISMTLTSAHAELPADRTYAELFPETQLPSFDCEQATLSNVEQMICDSAWLSYLDRMAYLGHQQIMASIKNYQAQDLIGQQIIHQYPHIGKASIDPDAERYHQQLLAERELCQTPRCISDLHLMRQDYCRKFPWIKKRIGNIERSHFLRQRLPAELSDFCAQTKRLDVPVVTEWENGVGEKKFTHTGERILNPEYFSDAVYTQTINTIIRNLFRQEPYPLPELPSGHEYSFYTAQFAKNWREIPRGESVLVDPWGEQWGYDRGVLGVLNNHPNKAELICGLPKLLSERYPESIHLPRLEPISRVGLREDAQFRNYNLPHSWQGNGDSNYRPVGQFRVGIEHRGVFWVTVQQRNTRLCFPREYPDYPAYNSSSGHFRNPMLGVINREVLNYIKDFARVSKYASDMYGFDTAQRTYQLLLGDKDSSYYQQQVAWLEPGKSYIPNRLQIKVGSGYLGTGNLFYSQGGDSPEGWFIYDGVRLGDIWRPDFQSIESSSHRAYPQDYLELPFRRIHVTGYRMNPSPMLDEFITKDASSFLRADSVSRFDVFIRKEPSYNSMPSSE